MAMVHDTSRDTLLGTGNRHEQVGLWAVGGCLERGRELCESLCRSSPAPIALLPSESAFDILAFFFLAG